MMDDFFKNNPNLLGIMNINGEHFVHFHIEEGYLIPMQTLPDGVAVKGPTKHNGFNYVILSSTTTGFDELVDIVNAIINFNRDKQAKEHLFEETLKSLQKIFNDSSVEELKTLVTTLNTKTETND